MKRNEYSIIQTIIDYNYSMHGVASLLKKIHMRGELEYTCEFVRVVCQVESRQLILDYSTLLDVTRVSYIVVLVSQG